MNRTDPPAPVPDQATLRLDYEQTLATYRQFAEIRFRLLAFIPTLSGGAVALLLSANGIDRMGKVGLALVGLLGTFAVTIYELRNTQLYNSAIGRARNLEKRLGLEAFELDRGQGLFGSRTDIKRRRLARIPIQHDLALALVYAAAMALWVFVGVWAAVQWHATAAAAAAVFFVVAFVLIRRLDRRAC